MSLRVKIVSATINIGCLLYTLFYPSPVTPVSLIPLVITAATWIFTFEPGRIQKHGAALNAFTVAAALTGLLCFLIGTMATISPDVARDPLSHYIVVFHPKTMALENKFFPYLLFALGTFILISALFIGEIWYTGQITPADIHSPVLSEETMDGLVQRALICTIRAPKRAKWIKAENQDSPQNPIDVKL